MLIETSMWRLCINRKRVCVILKKKLNNLSTRFQCQLFSGVLELEFSELSPLLSNLFENTVFTYKSMSMLLGH